MAKKINNVEKAPFSVEKLPLPLGVLWTFLSSLLFGALGAGVIILIARTF